MVHTLEVEIDEAGHVHPLGADTKLPAGRAILAWPDTDGDMALYLAEPALSDWLRPEEDEAWAHFQPAK